MCVPLGVVFSLHCFVCPVNIFSLCETENEIKYLKKSESTSKSNLLQINEITISLEVASMYSPKSFCPGQNNVAQIQELERANDISPLSPSLEIFRRSRKCVPIATSFTLSESRIWIFMRLHSGGNISVKTTCSFQIGS